MTWVAPSSCDSRTSPALSASDEAEVLATMRTPATVRGGCHSSRSRDTMPHPSSGPIGERQDARARAGFRSVARTSKWPCRAGRQSRVRSRRQSASVFLRHPAGRAGLAFRSIGSGEKPADRGLRGGEATPGFELSDEAVATPRDRLDVPRLFGSSLSAMRSLRTAVLRLASNSTMPFARASR